MKRRFLAAAAVLLAAAGCSESPSTPTVPEAPPSALAPTGPVAGAQSGPVIPGRVLVRLRPGARAAEVARSAGARVERSMTLGIRVLSVPAGAESRVAQALARNPAVEFAEPDWIRTFGDPASMPVDDPFIGYKWDLHNDGFIHDSQGNILAATGAADADTDWREAVEVLGSPAGAARIGIVDSGVRNDHQDLADRIVAQYDFWDGDGDAEDDDGHGTHVAGIAAARGNDGAGVSGVAWSDGVELVIAKVCGPSFPFGYGCSSSAIADGIVFAVDQGAHVLNLSLGGGTGSETTRSALRYARSNGVLPFCAAGNDGSAVSYPAAWPECVAVSATDWGDDLASYSNFGPEVELSAPGGDGEDSNGYSYILSAYSGSSTSYAFLAGTSMASPQAAGLGALLHALGVTGDDEKLSLMKSTADDLGASGTDDRFGAGRINVNAAAARATGGGSGGGGTTDDPPTASFTVRCTDRSCDFDASGSTDDGSIVEYGWDFGDGSTGSGVATSHMYAADGTWTVALTVTDDAGAADTSTQSVTVAAPSAGGITLDASGYKVRGRQKADLSWEGATTTQVDVVRDGTVVATVANDGSHTDPIDARGGGSYVYRVCEAGTSTCSSEVTVSF